MSVSEERRARSVNSLYVERLPFPHVFGGNPFLRNFHPDLRRGRWIRGFCLMGLVKKRVAVISRRSVAESRNLSESWICECSQDSIGISRYERRQISHPVKSTGFEMTNICDCVLKLPVTSCTAIHRQRRCRNGWWHANDGSNEGSRQRAKPFRVVQFHRRLRRVRWIRGSCFMNLWKSF